MDQRYCAFISYRHAPVDSKIAKEIQQRLERFRVPGAIARRTGKKRLGRVFRDKEELPITSDLNDNINRALENSEYLIVICSPRTRESIWVQKEIETFLQTHSRARVLTVLAEGEPGDVIPDVLLHDEITDPETGAVRTVEVEPLSCDYRLPLRQARNEELPRLASTILGCGYDELRQRQRLYKARRLTAILSGAMALSVGMTAYFLWSNRQIRENYRQSMINQSVYLASESQKARKDGDPITAALLAMAALPQDEADDRPVTPEAELALSQAVGAYCYDDPGLMRVLPLAAFSSDQTICRFWINDDASILAVINSNGYLIVWDTQTHRELWRRSLNGFSGVLWESKWLNRSSDPVEVFLLADGRLILWDESLVFCLDQRTGDELWSASSDAINSWASIRLALPTPDGKRVLLFHPGTCVQCLDASDGSLLWDCDYPKNPMGPKTDIDPYDILAAREFVFSPDGQTAMFAVRLQEDPEEVWSGLCLDLDKHTWSFLSGRYRGICAIYPLDGNSAAIMGFLDDAERASADINTYSNISRESTVTVSRESRTAVAWQTELSYCLGSHYESIRPTPEGQLFCSIANVMAILDLDTGETLGRSEAPSPIVGYLVENPACKVAALFDGRYGMFSYKTGSCSSTNQWFDPSVKRALCWRDESSGVWYFYVLNAGSNRVKSYSMGIRFDEHFTALDWEQANVVHSVAEAGSQRILGEDLSGVFSVSLPDGGLNWRTETSDEYSTMNMVGYCEATGQMVVSLDYINQRIAVLDAGTGALTELPEALELGADRFYSIEGLLFSGSCVCRLASYFDSDLTSKIALAVYDLTTGEQTRTPLSQLDGRYIYGKNVKALEDAFLLLFENDTGKEAFRLDPTTGALTPFDTQWFDWTPGPSISDGDRTLYSFIRDSSLCLTDASGAELQRITVDSYILSAACDPDRDCLLLLGAAGQVYVYSSGGRRKAVIDLGIEQITYANDIRWQTSDGAQWVVFINSDAYLIDAERLKQTAAVGNCWYVSGDRYFCTRQVALDDDTTVSKAAYYDRYSLDELVEQGRELAGDMKLKDPEKYGLPSSP